MKQGNNFSEYVKKKKKFAMLKAKQFNFNKK